MTITHNNSGASGSKVESGVAYVLHFTELCDQQAGFRKKTPCAQVNNRSAGFTPR
jgi:hypothetical protein